MQHCITRKGSVLERLLVWNTAAVNYHHNAGSATASRRTAPPARCSHTSHTASSSRSDPSRTARGLTASSLTLVATTTTWQRSSRIGSDRRLAVDVAEAPLDGCRRHFAERGLEPAAYVLGDGVAAVQADERLGWCETAIVAGVGPRTASAVVKELVLAPRRRRGASCSSQRNAGSVTCEACAKRFANNGYGVAEGNG